MKFIIGKKLEMSQRFKEDGTVVPVTLVYAPACHITQVKTEDKDGYSAVQVGAFPKKKINKSIGGHLKELPQYGILHEWRDASADVANKKEITIADFSIGDIVEVAGISKGRGFQGVVKRHGFSGGPKSHGHKDQVRMPGSIGAQGVAKVLKGYRMAGRMGNEQVTVKNLEIVAADKESGILAIKGAIPGARNSIVYIMGK